MTVYYFIQCVHEPCKHAVFFSCFSSATAVPFADFASLIPGQTATHIGQFVT